MKIFIADPLGADGVKLLQKQPGFRITEDTGLSKKELLERIDGYDAIIVRSATKVDKDVLNKAKSLRVVGRAGVGVDNIDIDVASQNGVIVTNTPDANTLAAAEHTLALLLAVCRNVAKADPIVKAGGWDRKRFMGSQLFGKTLGIVGIGRIGAQVAIRAHAFGMRTVAFDPYVTEERAAELGIELLDLKKLLREADFVSLHTPSTEATKGLIGTENLKRMKRGAYLVNCARGNLVDEAALAKALKSGRLAGAALDVFQSEPPTGSPLLDVENIVLTPHLAASTAEAQAQVSVHIAKQVIDILTGASYDNVLNLPFTGPFQELRPYLTLSMKVGSIAAQTLDGAIGKVEWDFADGPAEHGEAVKTGILRGTLTPALGAGVNFVNAQRLAGERKLKVSRTNEMAAGHHHPTVACRLSVGKKSRLVVGSLLPNGDMRIVQIDGFPVHADPSGDLLFTLSRDVPGVVGKIGTLLGKADVNIGDWRLGRDRAKKRAVTFTTLDSPVPPRSMTALRKIPAVLEAYEVLLDTE